jgi:hypothetical protein
MRHSFQVAGIAASFALVLMPVVASAQIHSHPSRHALTPVQSRDNATFQAYYTQPRAAEPAEPSCGSNCQVAPMYGIGY